MRTLLILLALLVTIGGGTVAGSEPSRAVADAESAYADVADAAGVLALLDTGLVTGYRDRNHATWTQILSDRLVDFDRLDATVPRTGLSAEDTRAIEVMRRKIAAFRPGEEASLQPEGRCEDAAAPDADADSLKVALYACFERYGNAIEFEGQRLTRVAALSKLADLDDPVRRKALFLSFEPLWRAVNGRNEPLSPYRRLIRKSAAGSTGQQTEIDAAAQTFGVTTRDVERWLEQVLDGWSVATAGPEIEPWDYRYAMGAADRELRGAVPRESLRTVNERYYADLGADLQAFDTFYDLEPRAGKAPLAYADFVTRGRIANGTWQPTVARVSGSYEAGGLGLLNELVHENGHVVHMMALHTRPAFMDLGDAVFYEAFADVPSWNTYEAAWQRKYLGTAVSPGASLRGLFGGVMLDVAWALFELRMLAAPDEDPNAVWSAIAARYLHVRPHPELSWWAVRVQLVDSPGYMVNYGLGAVLTADLRRHVEYQLGSFATGNPRWFGWLRERLLQRGEEVETAELLRGFFGRSITPDALLQQIGQLRTTTD